MALENVDFSDKLVVQFRHDAAKNELAKVGCHVDRYSDGDEHVRTNIVANIGYH